MARSLRSLTRAILPPLRLERDVDRLPGVRPGRARRGPARGAAGQPHRRGRRPGSAAGAAAARRGAGLGPPRRGPGRRRRVPAPRPAVGRLGACRRRRVDRARPARRRPRRGGAARLRPGRVRLLPLLRRLAGGRRAGRARARSSATAGAAGGSPPRPAASSCPSRSPPSRGEAPDGPGQVRYADGARSGPRWMSAVAEAVARITAGELDKVVLARDLDARTERPVDLRWVLDRLGEGYPSCWTFGVDGLVGATPELLVRSERGLVTSRVLAGTIRRTGDDDHDLALAASLARSSKDLEEHEYAVRSVADSLGRHCAGMNLPEAPFVLHLPNVMHLATDVTGVLPRPEQGCHRAVRARPGGDPAPLGGGVRHPHRRGGADDRRARGHGPRPLRRAGRAGSTPAATARSGSRCARPASIARTPLASGSSPAAASSRGPTPRPSWRSPTPSSCRCATPSAEPRVPPATRAGAGPLTRSGDAARV